MRAVIADTPAGAGDDGWPDVDVVMPIRDEADHLRAAVDAVTGQDYPGTLRLYVAVGPSVDGTEQLAGEIAAAREDVTVVDNPAGITPVALNVAIAAGTAPVIVRADGHSQLSPGYVRRAVETMRRTGAVNVGGRQVPAPTTPFEEAVAAATTSWLGTGGATYRVGGEEGPVDTVYLGVFDRAALEAVGGFDERLIRNQDYELNIRLRQAGGTVLFDPELSVGYRPRGSWRALARQYYEYGYWKAEVVRRHPESLRMRQLVPPVGLAAVVAATALGVRRRRWLLPPLAGVCLVLIEAARAARRTKAAVGTVAAVLASIPLSWSIGLARGALPRRSGAPSRTPR